jgi:hypothetical protein
VVIRARTAPLKNVVVVIVFIGKLPCGMGPV